MLHYFYKHMKFRNRARLCLAISDFEIDSNYALHMLRLSRQMFNCNETMKLFYSD